MDYQRVKPTWPHYRVIHSKHPPIDCFESPDHYLLGELESETSDRVVNWRRFVTGEDARFGPGWGAVMAAFCYPGNNRFNTSARGAYYAGDAPETAIREWAFHAARNWRGWGLTKEVSATVRCYCGQIARPLADLREDASVHISDDYGPGQAIAERLYQGGEAGILYRSLRHPGHNAIALLRPAGTSPVTQAGHYVLQWSGERFTGYAHIDEYRPL